MVQFNPTVPIMATEPGTGLVRFWEINCAAPTETTTCPGGAASDRNPVGLANQIQDFGNVDTAYSGTCSADFDIFTPLTARLVVGVDRSDGNRSTYWPLASPAGAGFGGTCTSG